MSTSATQWGIVLVTIITAFVDSAFGDNGVYVRQGRAYVVTGETDTLTVVDVAPVASASVLGESTHSSMDGPNSIYVHRQRAFVTGFFSDSLTVFDVSDPTSPTVEGFIDIVTNSDSNLVAASGVVVAGQPPFAYVASAISNSLSIFDVRNTGDPVFVGSVSDDVNMAQAYSVAVDLSINKAYVAECAQQPTRRDRRVRRGGDLHSVCGDVEGDLSARGGGDGTKRESEGE